MQRRHLCGGALAWAGVAALAGSAAALAQPVAPPAELLAQLRQWQAQRHSGVVLVRHASTEPGLGDPPGFDLSQCRTQRNLSEAGRAQARAIGAWFVRHGLPVQSVLSSQWCRCLDTARLMDVGPVAVEPSLASFFNEMHTAKSANQALQAMVAQRLKTKGQQALVLVTHHVNIYEFMGQNMGSGDMVLAQVKPNGQVLSHQVIPSPR